MKKNYLEVTFRAGKPMAAYLYLPRPAGAQSARTEDAGQGLRVDYDDRDTAIGVEITEPSLVTLADVNAVLERLGASTVSAQEWAPLAAA